MKSSNYIYLGALFFIFLCQCSPESTGVVSKAYHNTTARYNAIFYARERLNEIKTVVQEANENDYENILRIYPKFDTTLSVTFKDKTEDCMKKASLAITLHKNSNWVDEAYLLLGQARFYDRDFVNAIETFKFVNTKSEDTEARHRALVYLMNSFTDYKELNNASAAANVLLKEEEEMSKTNKKRMHLGMAHLYQEAGDYDKMVNNLLSSAPLMKKKEGRGRIYFIIGQIYQELNFKAEAYNYYRKVLKSKPDYELEFHTKLRMAQVTKLSDKSDIKTARKHFRALLKDKKNEEYKGLIYYELAEFERRLDNYPDAIEFFTFSVVNSQDNNNQKGKSYLKMGEIYFESLKNYDYAQKYYDSAVQALPSDFENLEQIQERKVVLDNLVQQLNTIQLQDSLLQLVEMDSAMLFNKLRDYLVEEQKQKEEEEQKAARAAARKSRASSGSYQSPFDQNNNFNSNTTWYFANAASVSTGRDEFVKRWGQRPLEDNWRRSVKASSENIETLPSANTPANNGDTEAAQTKKQTFDADEEAYSLLSQLPFDPESQQIANKQLEDAYYTLGNIYTFDLSDSTNAIGSYETLIGRYTSTSYKPEVLYLLYLLYKDRAETENMERVKSDLLANFPNTTYAKLVLNPNYNAPDNAEVEALKVIYTEAYTMFKNEEYDKANSKLDSAIANYEESVFTPWLKLLKILIVGKTDDIHKYKYELSQFIETHPDHEIAPYAIKLLGAADQLQKDQLRKMGIQFIKYFDQEHYYVVIYKNEGDLSEQLSEEIQHFNGTDFGDQDLGMGSLRLNQEEYIILVNGLGGMEAANDYVRKIERSSVMFKKIDKSKFTAFVITKDNFQIMYDNDALEEYLKFYKENYQ